MKKIGLKTRTQWGFYYAALLGILLAVLLVPASGEVLGVGDIQVLYNPVTVFLEQVLHINTVKIVINGKTVAIASSLESAKEAYKTARAGFNGQEVRILDVDADFILTDKEKDRELLKSKKAQGKEALVRTIKEELNHYKDDSRQLAYTVRIEDYTVTLSGMEEVVTVLEKAQGAYDTTDAFQVDLIEPDNHNMTEYEVSVKKKENAQLPMDTEKEEKKESNSNSKLIEQAAEDGIKNIGFSDEIQVWGTYASTNQITDMDLAYDQLVEEKGEEAVYVVQPGDYMELIAEKNNMSVKELRELNPSITSDEDLYYDDRLNVMVPTAAVSVEVEKQETYEENYYADVVYEDDDSMYIGESLVVQEGKEGRHIVTDLVTYTGDVETDREQMEETVEVAAVAQIVRRGTKSRPTYMYPVSNWNVTSNFGYRWGRLHAGTDIGIPTGTTVRASRSGKIITAGWLGGYGNCVMIDHGDGVTTVYGHLSQVLVSVGQYVDQGQQIALSGNTGRSTGPHLHFEIRVGGSATDATPYLEGRQ